MANFGLSKPWMAELDEATGTYKNAFKCGRAINTSVTPNYVEGQLFADNKKVENVREFKDANVALGVDRMPVEASEIIFGHKVDENGEEVSRTDDSPNFVGYGFITKEMDNGKKRFRSCLLLKVKFVEGEESFETKGDSIVFKTPTLNGTASGISSGEWRRKSPIFDTEEEADEWIQTQLGVS